MVGNDEEVERERRFDRWMLRLSRHLEPAAIVTEALRFIVEDAGASLGYLELFGAKGRSYAQAVGTTAKELKEMLALMSQTIVRSTLARGELIATSAVDDERFASQRSVRQNAIHAVACVPICEENERVIGVLYLQRNAPGSPFDETVRARLRTFAIMLAFAARRLVRREAKPLRRELDAHHFDPGAPCG